MRLNRGYGSPGIPQSIVRVTKNEWYKVVRCARWAKCLCHFFRCDACSVGRTDTGLGAPSRVLLRRYSRTCARTPCCQSGRRRPCRGCLRRRPRLRSSRSCPDPDRPVSSADKPHRLRGFDGEIDPIVLFPQSCYCLKLPCVRRGVPLRSLHQLRTAMPHHP